MQKVNPLAGPAVLAAVAEDHQIAKRCLNGEAGGWDLLYGRCHEPLVCAVKSLLGARARDAELVDEISARVWYYVVTNTAVLSRFDPSRNCRLTTFLAGIARNQVRTFQRSELRHQLREQVAARPEVDVGDPANGISDLELEELWKTLTPRELECLLSSTTATGEGRNKNLGPSARQLRFRLRRKIEAFLELGTEE